MKYVVDFLSTEYSGDQKIVATVVYDSGSETITVSKENFLEALLY